MVFDERQNLICLKRLHIFDGLHRCMDHVKWHSTDYVHKCDAGSHIGGIFHNEFVIFLLECKKKKIGGKIELAVVVVASCAFNS